MKKKVIAKKKTAKKAAPKKSAPKKGYDSFMSDKELAALKRKLGLSSILIMGVDESGVETKTDVESKDMKYITKAVELLHLKMGVVSKFTNLFGI